MPQKYKVYINDKVIIFKKSKTYLRSTENQLVYYHPLLKNIKRIVRAFIRQEKAKYLLILTQDCNAAFCALKDDYRYIAAGGGLVKNKSGKLLFIFRNGKWDLPKGKMEDGESVQSTSLREVKEETGLSGLLLGPQIGRTYHIYFENGRRFLKQTEWFEMVLLKASKAKPQIEEGITAVGWFDNNEIDEILNNTYPSISEMIGEYRKLTRNIIL
jgi:8-oxo-dGTP pyrophosphatase MutT (NUDIX family)